MNSQPESAVMGQKFAFATASLLVGMATFVNFLGLEKATLAILFGVLALRASPPPALSSRRVFAKIGVFLGGLMWLIVPVVLVAFSERIAAVIEALSKLP